MEPLAVSVAEAARAIGVSTHTLRRHIRAGKIPAVRVGRRILIRTQTVADLLRHGVREERRREDGNV